MDNSLLIWLVLLTAQQTDIPCSRLDDKAVHLGTQLLSDLHGISAQGRENPEDGRCHIARGSGMRDLPNMCFPGPEPCELAQPSNAFLQLFPFFFVFVVDATATKNAKSQPTYNEKNSLNSLPVQGAVAWPFQPKLELLEVHGGICCWWYHVNRIYEPFSMQELMKTC